MINLKSWIQTMTRTLWNPLWTLMVQKRLWECPRIHLITVRNPIIAMICSPIVHSTPPTVLWKAVFALRIVEAHESLWWARTIWTARESGFTRALASIARMRSRTSTIQTEKNTRSFLSRTKMEVTRARTLSSKHQMLK